MSNPSGLIKVSECSTVTSAGSIPSLSATICDHDVSWPCPCGVAPDTTSALPVGSTRTVKAEIAIPLTAQLTADAPFLRVSKGSDRTTCGTCHREEEPYPTIPSAFLSLAYKPEPGTFVTLEELEELHDLCTRADDPGPRCAMFHALFDFGEITEGSFSPAVATFQGP